MISFTHPEANIHVKLTLDGITYSVDKFEIGFSQGTDFKGQPQNETKGGQMGITISQAPDDTLYYWAKKATQLKNGLLVFETGDGRSILRIAFENAYCINLTCNINAFNGTNTSFVIAPETVRLNESTHSNLWS